MYTLNMNDNFKNEEEYKSFLLNLFKHLIQSKDSIEKNRKFILETIEKITSNKYLSLDEIKELASKNNVLSDLDLDDIEIGEPYEWSESGWHAGISDTSYTETTSDSYMATGLDDGGISESTGE